MRMPTMRAWGGALGAVALFGLLALGAGPADAGHCCFKGFRIANGSSWTLTKIAADFTRADAPPVTMERGPVAPGVTKGWGPRCCWRVRGASLTLCLKRTRLIGKKEIERVVTLKTRFPFNAQDRAMLRNNDIRRISVTIGESMFGAPSAHASFVFCNRKFAIRAFHRVANFCAKKKGDVQDPPIEPQEPFPFVRIRIRNGTKKKVLSATADGIYVAAPTQSFTIPGPVGENYPNWLDNDPGQYVDDKAHIVEMCVQVDLNGNTMADGGEYYKYKFEKPEPCLVKEVYFEVVKNGDDTDVFAYVVIWAELADSVLCSPNLEPYMTPDGPEMAQMVQLEPGDNCSFDEPEAPAGR